MAFIITKIGATPHVLKYSVHWDVAAAFETSVFLTNAQLLSDAFGGPLKNKLSKPVASDAAALALASGVDMYVALDQLEIPEASVNPPANLRTVEPFVDAIGGVFNIGIAGKADGAAAVPWAGVLTIEFRHTLTR